MRRTEPEPATPMRYGLLRTIRLTPYRPGQGPTFTLRMWDTGRTDRRGQSLLAYELRAAGHTLFRGEDFAGSPLHADDSDATVAALLGFLTLRPGDTDREYFADYTPEQLAFVEAHAEHLSFEAQKRFGDE